MTLDLLANARKLRAAQEQQQDAPVQTLVPAPSSTATPPPVQQQPAVAPVSANPFDMLKQTTNGFALNTGRAQAPPPTAPTPAPAQPTSFGVPSIADVAVTMPMTNVPIQMGDFPNQPVNTDEEAAVRFQQMLGHLNEHLNGAEIAENLATTLKFLEAHSFLTDLMKPADIQTFVRTMRAAYGSVIVKKTERTTKRKASTEKVEEAMSELASLGF